MPSVTPPASTSSSPAAAGAPTCTTGLSGTTGPVLERGIPKNDLYFRDHGEARAKIEAYYQIPKGKKLVLYAPTYRDDRSTDMYNLDYVRCLQALHRRFGGDWYFLIRLHPNLAAQAGIVPQGEKLRNATLYQNMQELLAASDIIISDYSGCAFDYLVLERPGFLYAEDYEHIRKVKDYYFTLEELPFSLAQSKQSSAASTSSPLTRKTTAGAVPSTGSASSSSTTATPPRRRWTPCWRSLEPALADSKKL